MRGRKEIIISWAKLCVRVTQRAILKIVDADNREGNKITVFSTKMRSEMSIFALLHRKLTPAQFLLDDNKPEKVSQCFHKVKVKFLVFLRVCQCLSQGELSL